jgi:AcrR family transcriptional regulator
MAKTNTRDRIREAALELFSADGYQKTSIARIETAAGLAPRAGAFYRHFESKEALLADLARSSISETPEELELDKLAAYGNTRSELVAIALNYEKASKRQQPFMRLIDELRAMKIAVDFENAVNDAMATALASWLETKPAARGLSRERLVALAVSVFGSWLFYLTKIQQGITLVSVDRDVLLDEWASRWAGILDRESAP